ncbi:MAG: hypothetical protein ABI878_06815 [Acidobacteriota bacterium]
MRYWLLTVTLALLQIGCSSYAQKTETYENRTKAERKPFQKRNLDLKSPESYSKRELENGKEYDHKPTVKLLDERAGNYEFSWIGYDKKKKSVIYQREDSVEAVVEAKIEKDSEGTLTYKYLVKNLVDSPTYLHGFVVQTIAPDVQTTKSDAVFIGEMSNFIKEYKEGVWKDFVVREETSPRINQGQSIEFSLTSKDLPGVVGCRASGGQGYTIGVGEHMPSELDRIVPVNLWAKGYTIGPIASLSKMNKSERTRYLLESLPTFVEAGWMSEDTSKIYRAILEREDLAGALEQSKKDLDKEYVTNEVFQIIEGLNLYDNREIPFNR